jgi:tetratricopeptide (TPR) repeat protein
VSNSRRASLRLVLLLLAAGCAAPPVRPPPPPGTAELLERSLVKLEHSVRETKRLLRTAREEAYAPELHLRLAELYAEMSRLRYLLLVERSGNKNERVIRSPDVVFLKESAIAAYAKVLAEWPRHPSVDKALFFMAHELRELGRFPEMVQRYEQLASEHPSSPLRLEALLLLGDHYFSADDVRTAEARYRSILAAKESRVHPMARYKLAWARINQNDWHGAFSAFEKIVKTTDPRVQTEALDAQKRIDVRREALLDLAFAYTKVRPAQGATAYFMDLCASRAEAVAVLRKLGNRLYVGGDLAEAARTYRALLDLLPAGEEATDWSQRLHDSVVRGEQNDRAAADTARLAAVLTHLRRIGHAQLGQIEPDFEVAMRDIATRRHQAGQSDATAASDAADAYAIYLASFPRGKEAPTLAANRAEALFAAERFAEAAEAFDALVRASKAASRDLLFGAVSGAHRAVFQREASRYQAARARAILRDAGRELLRRFPGDAEAPQVKFLLALTVFQEGSFEQAADLLVAFARQHPDHRDALTAAHLSLDALAATDDYPAIRRTGRRLLQSGVGDDAFRADVSKIVERAGALEVETLALERGGETALVALAERNRGTEVGQRALLVAFAQAQASGDAIRALALGERLRRDYPGSKEAAGVLRALGKMHVDRADPDRAAETLEAAFRADPVQPGAAALLVLAARLLELRGEQRRAADLLQPVVASGSPDEKRAAGLKRAELLSKLGDDLAAQEALRASADVSVEAKLHETRTALRLGDVGALRALTASDAPVVRAAAFFCLGELTYQGFLQIAVEGDPLGAVSARLGAVTQAEAFYVEAMGQRSAEWGIAALSRLVELYASAERFLDDIQEPAELLPAQRREFQELRESNRARMKQRGEEARGTCGRRARELNLFTPYARACLTGRPAEPDARGEAGGRMATSLEVEQARDALARKADDAAALERLAILALRAGDLTVARIALERALEAAGGRVAEIRNLLAVTSLRSGDFTAAHRDLRKAVDASPKLAVAQINLAALLASFGRGAEADTMVRRVGGLDRIADGPELWPEARAILQGGTGERPQ